ncbi:sulfite exporter TauE/SafE family protein [Kiloniella sp.]|uniref:sulfite exporter TauE/SafE family protein n=1 Tax=Kiloniella sp. TaxID=1938587 RepID=UPI003A92C1DA
MDALLSTDLLILAAILLATGVVAGLIAGLLGVGGGIVIVPVLYHLFSLIGVDESVRMHTAVGTSLATILVTGFASARSHYAKGAVDTNLLKNWGPAIAIGVLIGVVVGGNIGSEALIAVFAVIALVVAMNMAFRPEGAHISDQLPRSPFKQLIGVFIGGISVLMGIGGGTLSVPILTLFNYPIRKAVATASAIGLIIAVPGFLGYIYYGLGLPGRPDFSLGYVNLIGFALIIPTSGFFAPIGAKIAHAIPPKLLRLSFAFFLFITSLRMIHDLLT